MSDLLTIKDIAGVLDVQEKSARIYHETAQRNRRNGHPRDKDMPEPDQRFGRTPVWRRSTIDAWAAIRGKTPAKATAA